MLLPRIYAILLGVAFTTAAQLSVSISASQLLNPSTLLPSTHAVLLGPPGVRFDAPIRRDNTFLFPPLDDASYLLTIHSRDYFFAPIRVDVTKTDGDASGQTLSAWQTFRGNEWSNKGPQYGSAEDQLTIQVQASGQKDFYLERGGFNLIGFFKSPMILMALVSVVMIFGMPYLMENSAFMINAVVVATGELTDIQWIRKRRPSSKRFNQKVQSWAQTVL